MSWRSFCWLAVGGAWPVAAPAQADVTFKAEARLVEVHATVFDRGGKPVAGLARERFQVLDNGARQEILTFEPQGSQLACAILLDSTGSMQKAMPAVKNAVLRLIDRLREGDSAAVYSFSTRLTPLQTFTTDKSAAKSALVRVRTAGATALFDSLAQLAREVSRRAGKKVIVVFTDGHDTASALNAAAAVTRAKRAGVPIYAVAQGEALANPGLVKQLREVAQATGGQSYSVRRAGEVEQVFEDISRDLQNTYMLAYKPPAATDRKWREIRVAVGGGQEYRVRAKEGYFPE